MAETGVADPHHPLSHHGNDPEKIARMAKINAFHVSLFAYFLERLENTPEGNGTLLDHSLLLYGSGIGNPNVARPHRISLCSSRAVRPVA